MLWHLVELVVLLVMVLAYAIRTESFQTWLAHQAASYLSDELNTTVTIDRVHIHFFDGLEFRELYVEDLTGDTLLYAHTFEGSVKYLDISHHYLQLGDATLNNARVNLNKYEGDTTLNLQFLVDYFATEDTTTTHWVIETDRVQFNETRFTYKDHNRKDTIAGINYRDIDATHLNLSVVGFELVYDTVFANIERLSFHEQSGFQLDSLQANFRFAPDGFTLNELFMHTPASEVCTDLSFSYDSIQCFSDFTHLVQFENKADSIKLNLGDLAYFVPGLKDFNKDIYMEGTVKGSVSRLKGRDIYFKVADSTLFRGRFDLTGLPNIMETQVTIMVDDITTNGDELIAFLDPLVSPGVFGSSKSYMDRAGQVSFNGSFMGFVNDFVAYGEFISDVGTVNTDMSFHSDTTGLFYANGSLSTREFNVGGLIGDKFIGTLTSDLEVTAEGTDFLHAKARVDGGIGAVELNGYRYENCFVLGDVQKDLFNGMIFVRDENIDMNFGGVVDFRHKIPQYRFEGDIQNANLVKLKLIEGDPTSSLCLAFSADAEGNNLDNLIGNITLNDVDYYEKDREYAFGDITVDAEYYGDIKSLYVQSDMFDASITGEFKFDELPVAVKSLLTEILPSFAYDFYPERSPNQLFDFEIITEDISMLADLFMPGLYITPYSYIYGNFNSMQMDFGLSGIINELHLGGPKMHGMVFNVEKHSDVVTVMLEADNISVTDSISFQDFLVGMKARQDGIEIWMNWDNEKSDSWGRIEGFATVLGPREFEFDLWKSEVRLLKREWILDEGAYIKYDTTGVNIHGFEVCNGTQSFQIHGQISEDPKDKLLVYMDGFELNNINPLLQDQGVAFDGVITGGGYLSNLYHNIYFESDLEVVDLLFNNEYVGDVELKNSWDNEKKRMSFDGNLLDYLTKTIQFGGHFYPEKETDKVDLTLKLREANLEWLNGVLPDDVSHFQGHATGDVRVKGTFAHPKIDGTVKVRDGGVKVNMLNTFYWFGGNILLDSDEGMIALDYIPITDQNGQKSWANATFYHDYFTNFNFDIYLEMDSMLCLNTTSAMNDLYYGRALASGYVNVYTGYLDEIEVDVTATSERGTLINLPLSGSEDVVLQDFVSFVEHDSLALKREIDLTGVKMNFELDVTPDAKMRLIFDETIGDVMEGRGTGHISMIITTGGQFEMYGQYEVEEGNYMFTYQNTVKKLFKVKPGGTISWYGDPYEADLNLVAVFPLEASLADIMPERSQRFKKPVDVEVQMKMTKSLMNPDIEFDIDLPKSDEGTKGQLKSVVNSAQEMNRQVFALILLNQFLPPDNGIANAESNQLDLGNSGFALINNQINDLLSQISNDFDIGVNYTPGDQLTNEELALALSTQLLHGKIIIDGNFGVSNAPKTAGEDASSMIGDVNVEYLVNDDGTFRLHAFNESNDFDVTDADAARYTQGAGVYYEEEFNNLGELKVLQKFLNIFRACENKRFRTKPCEAKEEKTEEVNTEQ